MTKYQAYPEYKNSGVEWVGEIPSTWKVLPVRVLFDPTFERNTDGLEKNVLSLSYGQIVRRDVETNFGLLPESFNNYQIVNANDLILRLTDLQNDKRSLRVGLAKEKGIITSAYLKLAAKSMLDHHFAYRLLHSYDTTKVFYGMGGGLRQSLTYEEFKNLSILLPPLDEQKLISNFLDYETDQIELLIDKQKKLIGLLKEKRQALISSVVTKGLDPNVSMKNSGVRWLGMIPQSWEAVPLKYMCKNFVKDGPHETPEFIDSGIPFLSVDGIQDGKLVFEGCRFISLADHEYYSLKCKPAKGDVLLGKAASVGKVAYVDTDVEFNVWSPLAVITPKKPVFGKYIYYCLQSVELQAQCEVYSNANTQKNLGMNTIDNLDFPYPSSVEAEQIANYLDDQTSKIDALIQKAESAISLIQERRTALISAAVTGKIDVRNWQAPVTSEVTE